MSQIQDIRRHLVKNGSITGLEAVIQYRIMNLSERIREIERQGTKIKREEIESVTPGAAGNYIRYHLIEKDR